MNERIATGPTRESRITRWAGLGGAVYVALFVVGALVAYRGQPDTDSAPATIIDYYRDAGHRDKIVVGWLLIIIGVFFFLWFLGALRQAVRRLAGDGLLATVTTAGGGVYAALTLVAFSVDTALKTMSDDTYRDEVYPELIHAADDAGYVLHSAGGVAVAAMMVAASLAALGARALPVWLCWLGVLAGISAIVSIFFIPWFVIAVWVVVASVLLFLSRPPDSGL